MWIRTSTTMQHWKLGTIVHTRSLCKQRKIKLEFNNKFKNYILKFIKYCLANNVSLSKKYFFSIYIPGCNIYNDKRYSLALKKLTDWRGKRTKKPKKQKIKIQKINIQCDECSNGDKHRTLWEHKGRVKSTSSPSKLIWHLLKSILLLFLNVCLEKRQNAAEKKGSE